MRSVRAWLAAVVIAAISVSLGVVNSGEATASDGRSTTGHVQLNVHIVRVAGTRIAWAKVGRGRPLLLLNGTGSPMNEWDPKLLRELSRSRQVIVFDYPGLGLSRPAPGKISMQSMADWTASLIHKLKLHNPDVLGWSMGGFVAQQLAIRHPDKVGRMILAGTNPGGPSTTLGPDWVQAADSDPNAGIGTYLHTNYPLTPCAQSAGRAFVRRLEHAVTGGFYPAETVPNRTYNAMVRAEEQWLASSANQDALTSIAKPVLVMAGASDVITPPANSELIARLIPGASMDLYEVSGHSFLFQQPIQVAATIQAFLSSFANHPPATSLHPTACS